MSPHVCGQRGSLAESLSAQFASVGFVTRVTLKMPQDLLSRFKNPVTSIPLTGISIFALSHVMLRDMRHELGRSIEGV